MGYKTQHTIDMTYTGYIASGEENTAGKPVLLGDLHCRQGPPLDDPRVRAGWPCYAPTKISSSGIIFSITVTNWRSPLYSVMTSTLVR